MMLCYFFFFNDTATTEIYPLSLHDALPICLFHTARARPARRELAEPVPAAAGGEPSGGGAAPHRARRRLRVAGVLLRRDRKSTRLNSSHGYISYAVFCLKKKMTNHLFGDNP